MTIIVTLNGPIFLAIWGDITLYQAISGDIGAISGNIRQYWAISEDIGVISSRVKSVMCWARPIQVVPGQLFF